MKILISIILFFLFSCNNLSDNIKNNVVQKVDNAKQEMKLEVKSEKENFLKNLKNVEIKSDTNSKQKLRELNISVMNTAEFLDSLQNEMNKLDESDVRNVELVKNIFLYSGIGDKIHDSLKRCITLSQSITQNNANKASIQSMSDSLFNGYKSEKWTELNFGLTNPLGASMIIYGLQIELFRIGQKGLED